MAFIKFYDVEYNNTKNFAKVDVSLFSSPFILNNNLPATKITAFEYGHDTYVRRITRKEVIASLVDSKFYAPLDFFINRVMKKVELGFVDSNTLETIRGHMTTIMSLRGVANLSNKKLLIETYEKLFIEIEKATGDVFDYKR